MLDLRLQHIDALGREPLADGAVAFLAAARDALERAEVALGGDRGDRLGADEEQAEDADRDQPIRRRPWTRRKSGSRLKS